jgi:hypothetical protein
MKNKKYTKVSLEDLKDILEQINKNAKPKIEYVFYCTDERDGVVRNIIETKQFDDYMKNTFGK